MLMRVSRVSNDQKSIEDLQKSREKMVYESEGWRPAAAAEVERRK